MSTLKHCRVPSKMRRFGLRTFIETGCERGDGLEYALSVGFEQLHSCDIVGRHVAEARERYRDVSFLSITHADSLTFLENLPPWDIGPCFYWLDAHQPAHYDPSIEENERNKFPILHELELIRRRPGFARDVIMIDDLIAIKSSPRWHAGEIHEYFHVDLDFQALLESMAQTHVAEIDLAMEGTLTFLPRDEIE